mgnify:CR=1 FL=1
MKNKNLLQNYTSYYFLYKDQIFDKIYQYNLQWTDVDDTDFNIVLYDAPSGMTVSEYTQIVDEITYFESVITWTPLEGILIAEEIQVVVQDSGGETIDSSIIEVYQEFTINITPVNDPPQIGVINNQETNEGESLYLSFTYSSNLENLMHFFVLHLKK